MEMKTGVNHLSCLKFKEVEKIEEYKQEEIT
jgi:hypothetical protein